MAYAASASNEPSTNVQWMWNANTDPFTKSKSVKWIAYSDMENMIIEKAFATGEDRAILDDYHINFEGNLQVLNSDPEKQRPVKRRVYSQDDKRLRVGKSLPNPVAPDRPFGGQYGFISPFIKEVAKQLGLRKDQLPSKDETVVPMIVELAAQGIIEEGKEIRKKCEAKEIARQLLKKKTAGIRKVWKCCAFLYSVESFLYRRLNKIMRLIGSEEHEQVWRSKVNTLGPFCLLLWDNPFDRKMVRPKTILHRGANLPDDLIDKFRDDCSKNPRPWHTFQAFTSCSRNRTIAEQFGNVLFIMQTKVAFTVDLRELSAYPEEEEELLLPGVAFTVDRIESDKNKHKLLIYLTLQQRHTSEST